MHLTQFFGSSLEGFDLPDWPHIYLVETTHGGWRAELRHDSLPEVLRVLARLERSSKVNPISTLALHLPDAGIDPELLWPLIQSAPSVWFPSKSAKTRASESVVFNALKHFSDQTTDSDRHRERESVFHLLHRSWLKGSRDIGNALDLYFDTTFLRDRVSDAPSEIRVRLSSGSAEHIVDDASSPVGSNVDRFMLMGVATDGESILLKPHRKERGVIRLRFDSIAVLSESGVPLSTDQLLSYVQRYLHTDEAQPGGAGDLAHKAAPGP